MQKARKPRSLCGLLGLGLLGLAAMPAAAQTWPSDSGPTGDYLGSTVRQFERLSPPPVESVQRAERPVPGMPLTDVPIGTVDVGFPVVATPLRAPEAGSRRAMRRGAQPRTVRASARGSASTTRRSGNREAELTRELAERDREIQELRQRLNGR
ncbi:hypothetical protein [Roseomonas sp. WA12]